jgi:hypothetical protein
MYVLLCFLLFIRTLVVKSLFFKQIGQQPLSVLWVNDFYFDFEGPCSNKEEKTIGTLRRSIAELGKFVGEVEKSEKQFCL